MLPVCSFGFLTTSWATSLSCRQVTRLISNNFKCGNTETEWGDHDFHLSWSQYTAIDPTSRGVWSWDQTHDLLPIDPTHLPMLVEYDMFMNHILYSKEEGKRVHGQLFFFFSLPSLSIMSLKIHKENAINQFLTKKHANYFLKTGKNFSTWRNHKRKVPWK